MADEAVGASAGIEMLLVDESLFLCGGAFPHLDEAVGESREQSEVDDDSGSELIFYPELADEEVSETEVDALPPLLDDEDRLF